MRLTNPRNSSGFPAVNDTSSLSVGGALMSVFYVLVYLILDESPRSPSRTIRDESCGFCPVLLTALGTNMDKASVLLGGSCWRWSCCDWSAGCSPDATSSCVVNSRAAAEHQDDVSCLFLSH